MKKSYLVLSAVFMAGSTSQALAQAQSSQENHAGGLGDIIVTAQKREASLQETPISIVALSGDALETRGVTDLTDLRSTVPGLQVAPHPGSATTARVFLRGIGNNDDQITQDPSVAVYLDGVYVARSQGLAADLGRLERIEVLRGPQGALYGRNATGGAINYITRAPELGMFSGRVEGQVGNYDSYRVLASVNVPIDETLAIEAGYLRSAQDGYIKNLGTGSPRFHDLRRQAWRAAVLFQPNDALSMRYTYDRSEMKDTPPYVAGVPFYPAFAPRPAAGSPFITDLRNNDVVAQGHNLTINFEAADNLTLRSISGYRKVGGFTNQISQPGANATVPFLRNFFDQNQKQFSQEFQAVGDVFDGSIEYVLGAYYFEEQATSFDDGQLFPPNFDHLERTVTIDNKAYAVYGQLTWHLADALSISPSLRWSRDERKATLARTFVTSGGTVRTVLPTGANSLKFSNVGPGLIVSYDVTDDVHLFARWARGYKSGGSNVRSSTLAVFAAGFGEETLDSYEAGIKSDWFDRRLRFNLTGFVAKYKDIQVAITPDPVNAPTVTDVFNAGRATIKGAESEIALQPIDPLTFSFNYAYTDARYDKIINPQTGANLASSYVFVEVPKHSFTLAADLKLPPTSLGDLSLHLDYFHQTKKQTGSANDKRYVVPGYGLLNGSVTLSNIDLGFGRSSLSLFGKNMLDKTYYIAHYPIGVPVAFYGEPATYGVKLSVDF